MSHPKRMSFTVARSRDCATSASILATTFSGARPSSTVDVLAPGATAVSIDIETIANI